MFNDYLDYLKQVDSTLRQLGLQLPLRLDTDKERIYDEVIKLEHFAYFNHVLGVSGSINVLPLGGKTLEDFNRDRLYAEYEVVWQNELTGLTADLDVSEPSIKKFTLADSNLYNESLGLVPRQQDLSDIESKNLSFNVSSGQDASTIYNSESLFQNQPSYYEFDDDDGTEDEDYEDAYTAESEAYLEFDDDDDEECGYEDVSSNITGTSEHSYGYEFDEEEDEDFAEGSMSFDFDEDDDNAEYEDVVPEGYTYDDDDDEGDDVEYEDLSSDGDAEAEYEDVGGYSFDDDDDDVEYEDLSSDDGGDIEYEDVSSDDDDDIEYEDVVPEGYVYADDEDDDDVEYEDLTVYDEDDEDDVEYEDVGTYDSDEDEEYEDEEYEDEEYEDVGGYTSDEDEDEDEEYEDVGTYDSDEDENDEDYDDVYDEYSDDAVLGGIDVESIVQSIESGKYSTPVIQSARAVTVEPALTKPKENPFIYSDKQADSVKAGVNSALSGIFNRVTKLVSDRKSH